MKTYYFTYGTGSNMAFYGGWTEVIAHDKAEATRLFNAVHEPTPAGLVNCAGIYEEEAFKNTLMYEKNSNFGKGCHEVISISVKLL